MSFFLCVCLIVVKMNNKYWCDKLYIFVCVNMYKRAMRGFLVNKRNKESVITLKVWLHLGVNKRKNTEFFQEGKDRENEKKKSEEKEEKKECTKNCRF